MDHRARLRAGADGGCDVRRSVIFLDIDGVLNSTRYWWANKPLPMNQAGAIDPVAVARLNTIIGETGAAVVLSSWWRTNSYPVVQEMLRERGFVGELVGQTPVKLESPRHAEIAEWLGENACERFVVIDDDPDAWHPEMPFAERGFFASTNYLHGLADEHIPLICGFFSKEPADGA